MSKKSKIFLISAGIIFLITACLAYYFFSRSRIKEQSFLYDLLGLNPEYAQAYSLVNDTVSQSASIEINLPDGVKKEEVKSDVKFEPVISGKWLDSKDDKKIVFAPDKKLELGKYYKAELKTSDGVISEDFLVEEDPFVVNVFPKSESETDEKSEITIVFNRPMVPLAVLDVLYDEKMPIEISPETKGKFKWISTKSLQFIPDNTLIASANYKVSIKQGFKSMDNLLIKPFEHKFTTKNLRYENNDNENSLRVYNQPLKLKFNQEVNLEKTKKEIKVFDKIAKKDLDFVVEYGVKKILNYETKKYEAEEDRSVLNIYQQKDRHGREKFWDFNNEYSLKINKAYPTFGDINLDKALEINFKVSDVVNFVSVEQKRSIFSNENFFDPADKLFVEFWEEIDLDKSKIIADKLESFSYGEKCKESDMEVYYNEDECEKEIDKKKIVFVFKKNEIGFDENLKINLEKIVNISGQEINKDKIEIKIKTFPKLKFIKAINDASLTNISLCTNTPLEKPIKEDITQYLKVNLDYEFSDWYDSFQIVDKKSQEAKCDKGEFQTDISYGLMPKSDYELDFKLIDLFGEKTDAHNKFRTGVMPENFLLFYHYQQHYNVTTPDKLKLTYASENMEYVNMNVCKLEAVDMLTYLENNPHYSVGVSDIKNCKESENFRIDLEKKYWIKNHFQIDLAKYIKNPLGHYMLTFSHPNYKDRTEENKLVNERTYLSITNLAITEKKINIGEIENKKQEKEITNLYWISNLKTLEPVTGAKIDIYNSFYKKNKAQEDEFFIKKINTIHSDEQGIAKSFASSSISGVIVFDKTGKDSAILSPAYNDLESADTAFSNKKIYTYTDRPIYRPNQTVYIKGLYRIGFDGDYEIFQDKKIKLQIYDGAWKIVFEKELVVSVFGTFATEFVLDSEASLGQYNIQTEYGSSFFDVEEYVPAPFQLETKTDKEEYMAGEDFQLDIDANYYFGAPLEGGEIEYSIASQSYYFDKYQDEYFSFDNYWYNCYWDCSYDDVFILRNKIEISQDGKAQIKHKLDFAKFFKDENEFGKSKIFVVYMTAKNTNGQSISAQKSFVVHAGEFYIGINTDKKFLGKSENFKTKIKTVDTNGKEKKVENIELSINKVTWSRNKRKEVDGGFYYKWEEKITEINKQIINTGKDGNWDGDFSLDSEGDFRIIVKAKDERGNQLSNSYDLYVYGTGQADVMPSNDDVLELEVLKNNLNVGDNAEIIIKSPYESAKALIAIERGKIFDYKIIDINQNLYKYEFPIKENYLPNIFVSVTLLSAKPEIKYGNVEFFINRDKQKLDIEVKANKDFYLPGEEVTLDINAKDNDGKATEAELSIAVADLSVLALKGNPKKDPLVFFYDGFPLTVTTASNVKNALYEVDVPIGTKGGGGANAEDLAKKKRGEFKDTAFWKADLVTDALGHAQVKFKLPDNLTTWQIESLGITKDTKLGVDYQEFTSKKELMIVPLKPRFIIAGDEFMIGAKIFNQSDKDQNVKVKFENSELILDDEAEKEIEIDKKETKTVYFKVKSDKSIKKDYYNFTLSAKAKKLEDSVEQSIKINHNTTYETVASSGYSDKEQINEYVFLPDNVLKDMGELKINTSATLAVFLSDGLNYMLSYPYGNSEELASKLETIVALKKGLGLPNIADKFDIKDVELNGQTYTKDELAEITLKKLYKNQKEDGGFAYYQESNSSYMYLSLNIAKSFLSIKQAGFKIDDTVMTKLFNYINNAQWQENNEFNNYEDDTAIFATYVLLSFPQKDKINPSLLKRIKNLETKEKYIKENIDNISLTNLAMISSEKQDLFSKNFKKVIFDTLENRIKIDSRGAFLPASENYIWQNYETSIKNTALLLKTFVKEKKDTEIMSNILRWLLNSRAKDGSWGSSQNTIYAIDSLTDFLAWKQENKSEFNLKIMLNNQEKNSLDYDAKNILQQNPFVVAINELGFNKINTISFVKTNKNNLKNNFYYDVSLKYYLPANSIAPRDEGFTIKRNFYKLDDKDLKNSLKEAKVGDVLKGHLEIILPKDRTLVMIEDFIPAGFELVNFNLDTENLASIENYNLGEDSNEENHYDDYFWGIDKNIYPDKQEIRDDRIIIFKEMLSQGVYEYDYYLRALIPGKFQHLPAKASEIYFPENFGRTSGGYFVVQE